MTGRHLPELDKVVAYGGLAFSSVLTVWSAINASHFTYFIGGLLVFAACSIYLFIRRTLSRARARYTRALSTSMFYAESSRRFYLFSNLLFFALFLSSILFCLLRPEEYSRPLGYFVTAGLMASVLAVEILFLPAGKLQERFALLKIILLSVNIELSQVFVFPSIVGIDPWSHQSFTLDILKIGVIPGGFPYSGIPLMHILVGSFSLITGLDYKISAFLSISFVQAVSASTLVYLIGSRVFNSRIGLLGALLLGIANYELSMGYWAIPNTMATVFALATVFLLFRTTPEKSSTDLRVTCLILLFSGALIMTHTVTSVFMLLLLVVFCVGFEVRNRVHQEGKNPVPPSLPIFFAAGMLAWWAYVSGHLNLLATYLEEGFRLSLRLGYVPSQVSQYSNGVPILEQLFNFAGIYLFFTISFIGCLYMFSKYGTSRAFVIAASGVITAAMAFFAPIAGVWIITQRWFYFSQILLSLPLAFGLMMLCWKIKSRLVKSMLLASMVFLLTFLMILSPIANLDNANFSPNTQIRFAFTTSEQQALKTVASMGWKKIAVDSYYLLLDYPLYPTESIGERIYNGSLTIYSGEPILIREEIVNRPFQSIDGSTVYKLDYDPRETLTTQVFSKIYDSNSVSGFIRFSH